MAIYSLGGLDRPASRTVAKPVQLRQAHEVSELRPLAGNASLKIKLAIQIVIAGLQMKVRNMHVRRAPNVHRKLAIAFGLFFAAGCATSSGSLANPFAEAKTPQQQALEVEPMLQAAGFGELPAATSDQAIKLKTLPPLKLGYYDDKNGAKHYWMADPDFCKCLFHGDEAAYQRYENIKLENQVAERDRHAVEMQQQQQMMGPPGFGPPGMGFGGSGMSFGGSGFGFSF